MIPINKQSPVKSERNANGDVSVHSIFYTIQGEGPNVGRPAVFIRLAGCNLQCPGCDTEYTSGSAYESVGSICTRALATIVKRHVLYAPLAVITGGEPFRQNIMPLIKGLRANGFEVQVESNGTLSPWGFDAPPEKKPKFDVVVSPKAGKVHVDLFPFIIAYKYVVNHGSVALADGLPTSVLGMPAEPARPHEEYLGPVYIQPAEERGYDVAERDEKNQRNIQRAIKSAMEFGYTLCLQTHKMVGLE